MAHDGFGTIVTDRDRFIVADVFRLVILDDDVLVLFGVDIDLLLSLFILETNLVKIVRRSAETAAALDSCLGLVSGQRVRRHLLRIVDAADDDRLIGIAFEKVNDDFLLDARDVDHAPLLSRQRRSHAHPAGTVRVILSLAVPVKLNFNPAVFIGENLLARRAHDDRRLSSLHHRFRSQSLRPER